MRLGFSPLARGSWETAPLTPEAAQQEAARLVALRTARARFAVGQRVTWPSRKARALGVTGTITRIRGARISVRTDEGRRWWVHPQYTGLTILRTLEPPQ